MSEDAVSRIVFMMMPYGYPDTTRPDSSYMIYLESQVRKIVAHVDVREVVAIVIPGVEAAEVAEVVRQIIYRSKNELPRIIPETTSGNTPKGLDRGYQLLREKLGDELAEAEVVVLCDAVRRRKVRWMIEWLRLWGYWLRDQRYSIMAEPRRDVLLNSTWWFQGIELVALKLFPGLMMRMLKD